MATISVANDSIAFIDADDSDATKKESIVDLVSAIAHTGLTASAGRITADFTELSDDTTPELGGPLVTAGNRITHASSGTVSSLDFTKTLFSETTHTVLSSVKSIDLFLDANGGDPYRSEFIITQIPTVL